MWDFSISRRKASPSVSFRPRPVALMCQHVRLVHCVLHVQRPVIAGANSSQSH